MPPADYWDYLAAAMPGPQLTELLAELRQQIDARQTEFTPEALPLPRSAAVDLLDRVSTDGWLRRVQRQRCPRCSAELSPRDAAQPCCAECNEAFNQHGGVLIETVYIRHPAPSRNVEWVAAIHGMNTTGAWQEAFTWHFSTTWGHSVPVAVYKYGHIIAGVLMPWRRHKLQTDLRDKLAALRDEARARGFSGKPDVIAHSFGTWLLGHLLADELTRRPEERLRLGRVILIGCILRPDFDWSTLKEQGLVEDVLNHYGSNDRVVPLAHATIWDSGPSGRRGFDGDQVLNVRAEGYGHSDLLSIEQLVINGRGFQRCTGLEGALRHLEYFYQRYWRPFLTLPQSELVELPDRMDPSTIWRPFPWPLRGTMFPLLAIPLLVTMVALLVAALGRSLWDARQTLLFLGMSCAAGLSLVLAAVALMALWRHRGA